MLEDVGKVEFILLVVPGECHFFQVLHLLDIIVIVGNVPPERLSEGKQEFRITSHRNETRRIGVEEGPNDPEVLGKV